MPCKQITLPDGTAAIVCSRRQPRRRCTCGKIADRLCEWKVASHKSGTCDAPICAICSTQPSADKDLCPPHAREFEAWKASRSAA